MRRTLVTRGLEAFAHAFDAITSDGTPAALVVRDEARVLVDLAAGVDATGRAFSSETPVFLYSAVKPVAALAALLAVDRRELSLDATVAGAWSAFGAHGKHDVTVRHALAHAAGVPGWHEPMTIELLANRVAAVDALAGSPPWWPSGGPGEHATSYGHLVDAILRQATGRDITSWWADVIASTGAPITLRPGTGARAPAPLEDIGGRWRATWQEAWSVMADLLRNPPDLLDADVINNPRGQSLIAPAFTGYGSASDLATLYRWWAGGRAARRLGGALRDESLSPQVRGHDHILGRHVGWGLGPQIDDDFWGVGGCTAGHGPRRGLSIGFTTPRLGPLERLDPLDDAFAQLG